MSVVDDLNLVVDKLKEAIENKDWDCVSEVFFMITGSEKVVDEDSSEITEITQMFKVLQSRIDGIQNNKTKKNNLTPRPRAPLRTKTTRASRSKSDAENKRPNKFEEMTGLDAEVKRERGYDKINDNVKPSQRTRERFKTVAAVCVDCGKNFDIHPTLLKENYVCDKCLIRRK